MSKTYHFAIDIPVGAAKLYRAFTDEKLLTKWLTGCARVSIADGVYELWGRYVPDAPQAPVTKLIEASENLSLAFGMSIRGTDTVVRVSFTDAGLSILQDKVPRTAGQVAVEDFWGLALENLRRLLMGGSGPSFHDFGTTKTGDAVISLDIERPRGDVFAALTDPAQLDRYVSVKAEVEPFVGGKVDFGWGDGPVKILSIDPGREVSYTWHEKNEPETVVTWTLEGSGGGTRLTLVHSGFASKRGADDYSTGWHFFMNSLKSMVELGPGWQKVNLQAGDPQSS